MSLDLILRPLLLAIHAADIISTHLATLLTLDTSDTTIQGNVPNHVAFSLVGARGPEKLVKEVIEWAGERGVGEVSLWSEDGVFDSYSIPSVTSNKAPPSKTPDSIDTATPIHDNEDHEPDWVQIPSPSSTLDKPSPTSQQLTTSPPPPSPSAGHQPRPKHTYTVFPSLSEITSRRPHRPVTVHVLPRAAEGGTVLARITRELLIEGVRSEEVTQEMLDERIREHLGFQSDPCLLIIQPLLSTRPTTPLAYRALKTVLPADAPEVHGYPFWVLRVTEIFQAMPIRFGFDPGATEWDRAVRRWQGVEQRLGK
ncbi:hypothetical protein QFC20_003767 [Naganishia adeliensis]|uniref:Uncharacterized protein n=1 Tax=Naganishia adeliensis TaxID=92952 RepID=A0ACC2W805_9TREE|nr:hypothetical protein QFC20_003767 [Naganishia adeliensis]